MTVYQINPLTDPRWDEFVRLHPKASAFHTPQWLETLRRTYGYESFAVTTSPPGSQLTNGIVFSRIKSWLTGSRLVSVPFADHCEPLVDNAEELHSLLDWASRQVGTTRTRYVEVRPLMDRSAAMKADTKFTSGSTFRMHLIDLRPSLEEIVRSFHTNSVKRTIRKVEKEGLVYEEGSTPEMLKKFYHLLLLTRRRHGVPPQPLPWYRNLLGVLGEKAKLRMASCNGIPIASIVTLHHNGSVIYKYGCSDEAYNKLAGTVFLYWRAIQEAKESGAHTYDLGRSDLDNPGLIKFKSNWGSVESPLTYWRFPESSPESLPGTLRVKEIGGYVLSRLPDSLFTTIGRVLYRHAG